jgi:biotin transporter BioY
VAAAWLVGKLCEAGWDRRVWTSGAAMLIGTLVIYLFGLLWLARFVEPSEVIPLGLAPFVIGDGLKVALAAVTLPFGWRLVGRT